MIVVDSSVWIDFFRGLVTPQTERLDSLLSTEPIAVGDLILAEVLQGFRSEQDFNQARKLMTALDVITLGGQDIALQAARNYLRHLFAAALLALFACAHRFARLRCWC